MNAAKPRFELTIDANSNPTQGGWRFLLRGIDRPSWLEAHDCEPALHGERLELQTAVWALEALDAPAHVTILGGSHRLRQGLRHGLQEWASNDWQWEFFGQMRPVKDADLWRRMHTLLNYHQVEFRCFRGDPPHAQPRPPHAVASAEACTARGERSRWYRAGCALRRRLWESSWTTLLLARGRVLAVHARRLKRLWESWRGTLKPCPGGG